MKTVNRVLVIVILGIAVVLGWAWVARTDWASTRDILGVGEGFEHPLEPIIKISALLLIAVTGTKLIERGFRSLREPDEPQESVGLVRRVAPGRRPEQQRFREEVLGLPPLPTKRRSG
jgi:hypothetical protein